MKCLFIGKFAQYAVFKNKCKYFVSRLAVFIIMYLALFDLCVSFFNSSVVYVVLFIRLINVHSTSTCGVV